MNGFNLGTQIVGHGAAILFVGRVNFIAKRGAFGVEHTGCIVGWKVFAQTLHHVDHAANGAGGRAAGVAWHRPQIGHGMKGSVQIAGTIHQQ